MRLKVREVAEWYRGGSGDHSEVLRQGRVFVASPPPDHHLNSYYICYLFVCIYVYIPVAGENPLALLQSFGLKHQTCFDLISFLLLFEFVAKM